MGNPLGNLVTISFDLQHTRGSGWGSQNVNHSPLITADKDIFTKKHLIFKRGGLICAHAWIFI